jgi:hypothetical protein
LTQYQSLFKTDEEGNILKNQLDRTPVTTDDINILILDFSPRPIIRQKERITHEWRVDSGQTHQDVVCRLPFRAFQRPADRFHHDVVIGPDHLVAITVRKLMDSLTSLTFIRTVQTPVEYEVIQFSG